RRPTAAASACARNPNTESSRSWRPSRRSRSRPENTMDLRKLKKLIDLVQESGISELEVTEGEEKVRIAKHTSAPPATYYAQVPPAPAAAPAAVVASPALT